jgi:hypothetical protein
LRRSRAMLGGGGSVRYLGGVSGGAARVGGRRQLIFKAWFARVISLMNVVRGR